jgi:hypothetical protein
LSASSEFVDLGSKLGVFAVSALGIGGLAFLISDHLLSHYAEDFNPALTLPPDKLPENPTDILESLDELLGSSGKKDFAAATVLNSSTVESPDFIVSSDSSDDNFTVVQRQSLLYGTHDSDAGTAVVNLDATNSNVDLITFSDATDGETLQLLPDDGATTSDSQGVRLVGAGDAVEIDNPTSYTGTISNYVAGDTIDLSDIGTATGATLGANNVLTVTGASGGTVTLHLNPTQNYASDDFMPIADGDGGTDIVLPTVKVLATFTGPNGANPEGGLIEDRAGNLFGGRRRQWGWNGLRNP